MTTRLIPPLVLVLAILLSMGGVLSHGFLKFDDDYYVYDNPNVNGFSLQKLGKIWAEWKEPYYFTYMPVTHTVSAMLSVPARSEDPRHKESGALNPFFFHAAGLVLHILCALLVYFFLLRLAGEPVAALLGAMLFAVHPVQVDSVAWISNQKGLLSSFFCLGSLIFYDFFRRSPGPSAAYYSASLAAFCLALLSKASVAAFPLVFLLLKGRAAGSPEPVEKSILRPRNILPIAPFLAGSLVMGLLTTGALPKGPHTELWMRPLVAGDALLFYFSKLLWPWNLALDYARSLNRLTENSGFYFFGILPWIALAIMMAWPRLRAFAILPLSVFLAAIAPTLGFLNFSFQEYSTVADRYLHLPMLGLSLAAAIALSGAGRLRLKWAAAALLAVLCWRSAVQTGFWKNTETLFRHNVAVAPDSWVSHNQLAVEYDRRGDLDSAFRHIQEALRRNPPFYGVYYNHAQLLWKTGRLAEAQDAMEKALSMNPGVYALTRDLTRILLEEEKYERALACALKGISFHPPDPDLHQAAALALSRLGRWREAVEYSARAADLKGNGGLGGAAPRAGNRDWRSIVISPGKGDLYAGKLAQGRPHGPGVLRLGLGLEYEGEFRDGQADGKGTLYDISRGKREILRSGDWTDGRPVDAVQASKTGVKAEE